MKKLGQHFLASTAVAQRIVDAAHIQPYDVVLEVGPGRGMLTQFLAEKAKQVIAVEKDANLVAFLQEKLQNVRNLEVFEGDVLKIFNFQTIFKQFSNSNHNFPKKYKIVANLPYYITSRFLRLFLEETKNKPQSMILMVQKEVAERICAKPPHMNLLALSVQVFGKPKTLFHVKRGSFSPSPKVDSAVIAIDDISDIFFTNHRIPPPAFFKQIKKAFSQKRKMLRSSIGKSPEVRLPEIYKNKRPQELSLNDWVSLSKLGAQGAK